MTFCKHCGQELPSDDIDMCPHCGEELDYSQKPESVKEVRVIQTVPHKSPGTAALIAFIGGIFGFMGIGHIYVGRVGRGIAILLGGFMLYILVWITLFGTLFGGAFSAARNDLSFLQIGGMISSIMALSLFGLFVWQILDAKSSAKKYNKEQLMVAATDPE